MMALWGCELRLVCVTISMGGVVSLGEGTCSCEVGVVILCSGIGLGSLVLLGGMTCQWAMMTQHHVWCGVVGGNAPCVVRIVSLANMSLDLRGGGAVWRNKVMGCFVPPRGEAYHCKVVVMASKMSGQDKMVLSTDGRICVSELVRINLSMAQYSLSLYSFQFREQVLRT